MSTGTGRATGLELLVRRTRGRVTGWGAYTLATSTRDLYGYTVPSDFDRRHTVNAILEASLTRRVRAAMTWQLASGFPTTPVLEEVSFYQGVDPTDPLYRASRLRDGTLGTTLDFHTRRLATINSERLSGYRRADVRGTYSTLGHWEFYGEVLNLFNNGNQEQTIRDPIGAGLTNSWKTRVYNTFERMFAYGVRVKF